MSIKPGDLYELTTDQLLERSANAQPESAMVHAVVAEFSRRALIAQIDAAKSAEETAKWTRYSAIAIALSVIVMAIGTLVDCF